MSRSAVPHDYTQLTDDEDDDFNHREPVELAAPGSETARALQPVFAALQQRLKDAAAARPVGAGVTVSITVGTTEAERWLVDAREGIPPDAVVTWQHIGTADDAAVRVHVPEPTDLLALLERRLPPFRALAQRRLILRGDLAQLRSMQWLIGGTGEGGEGESSAVRVRVLHADAAKGHGEYVLSVEEGAVSWLIARRWSELKAMNAELALLYGRGSGTLEVQLPAIPTSYRSSTSATLLALRSRQMAEHLAKVLQLLHCSPRNGDGPPALLRFLRPTEQDGSLTTATLPLKANEAGAAGTVAVPPPVAVKGGGGEGGSGLVGSPPRAHLATGATSASGGAASASGSVPTSPRKEIPMAELLLRRRIELAEASVLELSRRAERASAWATRLGVLAALACLGLLALLINGGAWLSALRGGRGSGGGSSGASGTDADAGAAGTNGVSAFEAWNASTALLNSTNKTAAAAEAAAPGAVGGLGGMSLLLLGALLVTPWLWRRRMGHEKAALYWRYAMGARHSRTPTPEASPSCWRCLLGLLSCLSDGLWSAW